jgi:hypothetical protein
LELFFEANNREVTSHLISLHAENLIFEKIRMKKPFISVISERQRAMSFLGNYLTTSKEFRMPKPCI